jgi:decaprenylphospho-beta-D-ribofuranose 2-oxidase
MIISGWGNYPRAETRLITLRDPRRLSSALADGPVIARGAGRAYGDAAIGSNTTLALGGLDRMIAFDPLSGRLTCEAGVLLSDIVDTFLPRGFFPAVVPGTRHVTVGGMIACDVHGKNHHKAGSFGGHVEALTLIGADGTAQLCSPTQNAELFCATIGGMGLTGVIRDATFCLQRLDSAFVRTETVPADDLDAVMEAFEDSKAWTYTVAWIDALARGASLGRSVLFRGEHAVKGELDAAHAIAPYWERARRPVTLPFDLPGFALNRLTVQAFNALYFRRHQGGKAVVPLRDSFFPLDAIGAWNRIYGRRGFVQHQCVIPKAKSRETLGEMLELVSARGNPSFLAVLKLLGPGRAGLMSFPQEGYTLALDFPAGDKTFRLLDQLDALVLRNGGRLYLAKDARQSRTLMEAGYGEVAAFRALRGATGAAGKFRSLLSERLAL